MELFFPDLTKLKPTILSTVLKATEEYGELSREVHNISNAKNNQKELQKNIPSVLGELLDVAQTMFTLIYFMQKTNMMPSNFLEERLKTHVSKLVNKGYLDSSLKTCCTLLYIFQDEYSVDVESLLISHRKKLEEHGYC